MTPRGRGLYGPQGPCWQDLLRGPLYIAKHKIGKLCALWFYRRRFFLCFPIANDPRGGAIFDPGDMAGRIY